MKTQVINEPYKCKLCNQPAYKNANGIVRHIKSHHNDECSIEEYFKKYISVDQFKQVASSKVIKSSMPIEYRLTSICLECRKDNCNFQSFGKGFGVFCSEVCANNSSLNNKIKYQNTVKSIKEKYGVENISQHKETAKKVKETKLKRYDDERYNNTKKQQKTIQERFGSNIRSFTQTEEYKTKTKQTSLEKYGVDHFTKSQIVKDKAKSTVKKRYNCDHILQVPKIRKQIENTNIKKYGVKSILELPEVRKKGLNIKRKKFVKRLNEFNFSHVTLLSSEKNLFKCGVCQKIFKQKNITLKSGSNKYPRCIDCYPVYDNTKSVFQQEFSSFLTKNKIKFIPNSRKILGNKQELDFFLPNYNVAFELNGLFWHAENFGNKKRKYHITKTELCENKKIRLIHIFSDEWDNKREIVESKILHILGISKAKKIYARNCCILPVENKTKNMFLNKNHIQGTEKSSFIKPWSLRKKIKKIDKFDDFF